MIFMEEKIKVWFINLGFTNNNIVYLNDHESYVLLAILMEKRDNHFSRNFVSYEGSLLTTTQIL